MVKLLLKYVAKELLHRKKSEISIWVRLVLAVRSSTSCSTSGGNNVIKEQVASLCPL